MQSYTTIIILELTSASNIELKIIYVDLPSFDLTNGNL
jgi:hypothetical protein